ncbi:SufS family cysteine desulfurase [Vibrio panuliri]|uniref:Cysteine desulfurase n=1 Tax=Vibrio panuliri TaxID=1381081 RepID=A0ABX3FU58_9VIBR|nr:SufS family cysteine desulfurase [Vibrio panuliri]KAB1457339.1 SufS family cysteine desulfurase [Vibrio panuliri]OLQ96302.1 cysteine sulfinate desulfinase [Vibrio panuliri]
MRSSQAIISPWFDDFPTLKQKVYDSRLVYLDTAATAQTPNCVIDRMTRFYQQEYASVHRGIHYMSAKATEDMEMVRHEVAKFVQAGSSNNIIFTKGSTEAINLVAYSYLKPLLAPGDEIIISEMEHHANIVPWQLIADMCGAQIKVWGLNRNDQLSIEHLQQLITSKTRLIAVTHVSNVLGVVNPIKAVVNLARKNNIAVLVDGAQAVMHQRVDVTSLDCDFYVFSAHKLYGPTGTGVLYAKSKHLERMIPWEGGGAMIDQVTLPSGTSYGKAPWRFEAGTPNIVGILGLGVAIRYLQEIGIENIAHHETKVMRYLTDAMSSLSGVETYGNDDARVGVLSFNVSGQHAFDIGSFLDRYGVAIRTGHHCAMPLIKHLGQSAVCRASIGMYSQSQDVDALVHGLSRIKQLLR